MVGDAGAWPDYADNLVPESRLDPEALFIMMG
jgi:hypothetical protein